MPLLLVLTVGDRPRHAGADRAMDALLRAFTFAPVVQRQPWDQVVVLHAEIPDVQLEQVPVALAALQALDDVRSIALVTLVGADGAPVDPSTGDDAGVPGDGESVRRPS